MAFLKDPVANRPSIRWNEQLPDLKMTELLNLGGDTTRVDLSGGHVVSVELPPWAYVINSEVNLHAKSAWGQSLYGLRNLAGARHAEMYNTGDPSQYVGLEVGTGDFTVEALTGGFQAGVASGGCGFTIYGRDGSNNSLGSLWAEWDYTAGNNLRAKMRLTDNTGTQILNVVEDLGAIDVTQSIHVATVVRRAAAGNPIGLACYVNGVALFDGDTAENDSGLPPEFSSGGNIRVGISSTPGGASLNLGDAYFIRAYKRELSAEQVQARAQVAWAANSRVIDAAYTDMFFEIDFQDQANWADPAEPESSDLTDIDPSYTKIVFNDGNLVAGDVQLADGGVAATPSSAPIKAGVPTPVIVSGKYLSLLSAPGEAGAVWITPV